MFSIGDRNTCTPHITCRVFQFSFFFSELVFSFTQGDYEAVEDELIMELFVDKFQELANPVNVTITPLTVANAEQSNADNGTPLPPNLNESPNANDDPIFSPNRAKGNIMSNLYIYVYIQNYQLQTVHCFAC